MGQNESIDLANEIEKLNEKIGIPRNLKEMGITEDLIPNLVAHAKEDPSNLTTPRLPTQNEVGRTLSRSIGINDLKKNKINSSIAYS